MKVAGIWALLVFMILSCSSPGDSPGDAGSVDALPDGSGLPLLQFAVIGAAPPPISVVAGSNHLVYTHGLDEQTDTVQVSVVDAEEGATQTNLSETFGRTSRAQLPDMRLIRDGNILLFHGSNLVAYDLTTRAEIASWTGAACYLLSPDGDWMFVASGSCGASLNVYLFNVRSGENISLSSGTWRPQFEEVANFSADSKYLYYHRQFGSQTIRRDLDTGQEVILYNRTVRFYATSPNGRWAAVNTNGNFPNVTLLDLQTSMETTIIASTSNFNDECRAGIADDKLFASCFNQNTLASEFVYASRTAAWSVIRRWVNQDIVPEASPGLRHIAYHQDGFLHVYDSDRDFVHEYPSLTAVVFSPSPNWMAAWEGFTGVSLIDLSTGAAMHLSDAPNRPQGDKVFFIGSSFLIGEPCNVYDLNLQRDVVSPQHFPSCVRVAASARWAFRYSDSVGIVSSTVDAEDRFMLPVAVASTGFISDDTFWFHDGTNLCVATVQ